MAKCCSLLFVCVYKDLTEERIYFNMSLIKLFYTNIMEIKQCQLFYLSR